MVERDENGRVTEGSVLNPSGRPRLPQDVLAMKRINAEELERVLNRFLQMSRADLKAVKEMPQATMLELIIHSIVTQSVNKGDHQRFSFLLDRLIGKMKQQIEHSGEISNPYLNKTKEELEAIVRERLDKQ